MVSCSVESPPNWWIFPFPSLQFSMQDKRTALLLKFMRYWTGTYICIYIYIYILYIKWISNECTYKRNLEGRGYPKRPCGLRNSRGIITRYHVPLSRQVFSSNGSVKLHLTRFVTIRGSPSWERVFFELARLNVHSYWNTVIWDH